MAARLRPTARLLSPSGWTALGILVMGLSIGLAAGLTLWARGLPHG
ncbi:hypothetical protein [Caulobacter segnis]|uniref:Putative lysyl-tRNA synthetase n=1 Tax=Caulobacter segnis (strain ATCC 21756 / DSM 7131 / JCM 7823 / NBRC 15250 / LMG 17158 / TK0059) TaxID=509190 RepID=D5VKB1_CAUST|nr:hypothetical protein [Caulobacter segnis]ADG10934.1 putative lysyl-tRNA synthetase [Caulobacter segnis ATCC 21756]